MKVGLCFCLVSIAFVGFKGPKALATHPDASPRTYPFHALVRGLQTCNGILISEYYIITLASCVHGAPRITVFLGFSGYPYLATNQAESSGQIHYASKSIIHESYAQDDEKNTIALVKLPEAVKLSDVVQPGKLITKVESRSLKGKTVQISGWILSTNTNLKVAEVKIRDQDKCEQLFEDKFDRNQENCVQWFDTPRLNLVGNAVTSHGKIVGLQIKGPTCVTEDSNCTCNDVILNVAPFLDWISKKNHIPTAGLTRPLGTDDEVHEIGLKVAASHKIENNNDIDGKIDKLQGVIEGVKKQQLTDIADLNKKLDQLLSNLQKRPAEGVTYAPNLDERINDIEETVANSKRRQDANIAKLRDELQESKNQIANGLAEQKNAFENLAKRIEDLGIRRPPADEERLAKLENALQKINEKNDINKLKELGNKFQQGLNALNDRLARQPQVNPENVEAQLSNSLRNLTEALNERLNHLEADMNQLKFRLMQRHTSDKDMENKLQKTYFRLNQIENSFIQTTNNLNRINNQMNHYVTTFVEKQNKLEETCCGTLDGHISL